MVKPANDKLNRDVRRYQIRLKVTAAGVLIFAFWGIIRNVMMTIMDADDRESNIQEVKELFEGDAFVIGVAIIAAFIILFLLDTIFRVRIFMLARRESSDPSAKRTISYLIMAGILIISSIYTISNIGVDIYEGDYKLADAIVSIIIEFSSMITLIELIDAALTLRKLRDKQKVALNEATDKATEQVQMEAEDTAEQLRQVVREAADE